MNRWKQLFKRWTPFKKKKKRKEVKSSGNSGKVINNLENNSHDELSSQSLVFKSDIISSTLNSIDNFSSESRLNSVSEENLDLSEKNLDKRPNVSLELKKNIIPRDKKERKISEITSMINLPSSHMSPKPRHTSSVPSLERKKISTVYILRSHSYTNDYALKKEKFIKETFKITRSIDWVTGNKIINRYMILKEIGRGVHGKVKLGIDIETGEYYAIKIVKKSDKAYRWGGKNISEESSSLEKIKKEIAILKKCIHPNIVRLYEVINDPTCEKIYLGKYKSTTNISITSLRFLVLEYLERGDIKWRDHRENPLLCEETARKYFRDVVLGLEYCK
jgi:hypothetical protein